MNFDNIAYVDSTCIIDTSVRSAEYSEYRHVYRHRRADNLIHIQAMVLQLDEPEDFPVRCLVLAERAPMDEGDHIKAYVDLGRYERTGFLGLRSVKGMRDLREVESPFRVEKLDEDMAVAYTYDWSTLGCVVGHKA